MGLRADDPRHRRHPQRDQRRRDRRAAEDNLTPWETDQAALWPAITTSPAALVQVDGASHYTFSDSCRLLPIPDFCGGDIDLERAHALIRSFTLAWLDRARGVEAADAWLPPTAPELDYTAQ